jgi:hypothetical protein
MNPFKYKGKIAPDARRVGDLNTLLSSIGRSSRQKLNKYIIELNNIMDKRNLTDIYTIVNPIALLYFSQNPMELSPK